LYNTINQIVSLSNSSLSKISIFESPRIIYYGLNSVEEIGKECKRQEIKKVLILTDEVIAQVGHLERVEDIFDQVSIKTEVIKVAQSEPVISLVEQYVELTKTIDPDLIVGLGGGSVMDTAKLVSMMQNNVGSLSDYIGVEKVPKRGVPTMLIATTSGTGSEVTHGAVVKRGNMKEAVQSHQLIANIAVVDPSFTLTLPSNVVAATGMDALTHAIESYISIKSTPFTDSLALKAIEIISKNLRESAFAVQNLEARCNMAMGSLLAGLSFSNAGLGAAHALSMALGQFGISHGVATATILPYVMEFNRIANPKKFVLISKMMGGKGESVSTEESGIQAVIGVKKLIQDLNLPLSLRELGIERDVLPKLAKDAATFPNYKRLLSTNPRKIQLDDLSKICENAWDGKLI